MLHEYWNTLLNTSQVQNVTFGISMYSSNKKILHIPSSKIVILVLKYVCNIGVHLLKMSNA